MLCLQTILLSFPKPRQWLSRKLSAKIGLLWQENGLALLFAPEKYLWGAQEMLWGGGGRKMSGWWMID